MKLSKFISLVAKKEGKKVQTTVQQIREIFKVAVELAAENPEARKALKAYLKAAQVKHNLKVAKAKAKKKKK